MVTRKILIAVSALTLAAAIGFSVPASADDHGGWGDHHGHSDGGWCGHHDHGGWGGWGHDYHHHHGGGWGGGYAGYGGYGYETAMCRYADGSIALCPTY